MRLAELGGYTSPTKNMTESKGGVKPILKVGLARGHAPIELGGCRVASIHRAAEKKGSSRKLEGPRVQGVVRCNRSGFVFILLS